MHHTPSTELAIPSAQLLCDEIIRRHGSDRGNGERIRLDADLSGNDIDGTPYKMRLIQQGMGARAFYTLRASEELSSVQSIYMYSAASNSVEQRLRSAHTTSSIALSPSALVPLLYSALEHTPKN